MNALVLVVVLVAGGAGAQGPPGGPQGGPLGRSVAAECDPNPCGEGVCRPVINRATDVTVIPYRCICPLGYRELITTATVNGTCLDVDECKMRKNPCGKGSKCTNSAGGFSCECLNSHYWDGYECVRKGQRKDCRDKEFPDFLVKPQESVKLELGDELKLTCVAKGHPSPNIYWTKGPNRRRIGPMSVGQSIFFLPNITKKDVDVYECVLEDCCSGRIARAKVDVAVPSLPCDDPSLKMFGTVWEYKTWDEAVKFCQGKNLTLAVIQTEEERKIIRNDAWKSFLNNPNGKKFANDYWMWIGLSDRSREGTFVSTEGEEVDEAIAKWMPGTPDNWSGLSPHGQDVVSLHRLHGGWDDSYGFHLRPFACKCPAKELEQSGEE